MSVAVSKVFGVQVAPAFAQLLAPYNVRFVRGSVASVEPQETLSDGSTASGVLRVLRAPPLAQSNRMPVAHPLWRILGLER